MSLRKYRNTHFVIQFCLFKLYFITFMIFLHIVFLWGFYSQLSLQSYHYTLMYYYFCIMYDERYNVLYCIFKSTISAKLLIQILLLYQYIIVVQEAHTLTFTYILTLYFYKITPCCSPSLTLPHFSEQFQQVSLFYFHT